MPNRADIGLLGDYDLDHLLPTSLGREYSTFSRGSQPLSVEDSGANFYDDTAACVKPLCPCDRPCLWFLLVRMRCCKLDGQPSLYA
jgi:hypothetical protein